MPDHKKTIYIPTMDIEMVVPVPEGMDDEECVDSILDEILTERFKYLHWDFVDGIS